MVVTQHKEMSNIKTEINHFFSQDGGFPRIAKEQPSSQENMCSYFDVLIGFGEMVYAFEALWKKYQRR